MSGHGGVRSEFVVAGPQWVWGIDPGLSRVAVGVAAVDGGGVEVETLITKTDRREGERLGLLDRQLRIYARQLAWRYPPAVIWVEQASGRWPNLQLGYAIGVIQAALFETLRVPVWTVPSSAWKKRAGLRGNATKPQIRAHAEGLGVSCDSQDECDAALIACAGRAMFIAGSWDAGVAA